MGIGYGLRTATAEPQKHTGVRAPLFDRLQDDYVPTFYTKEAVQESIERELSRLLNTRTALKREEFEELSKDPENFALPEMYGIPEFSLYDGMDQSQWLRICETCARSIAYFEPRLTNVNVQVAEIHREEQALILSITAQLNTKPFQDEVSFPMAIGLAANNLSY